MECNEHYLHSINIYGATTSLVANFCFDDSRLFLRNGEGKKRKKIFNKRTPDTKQHFTFVVVKKVTFYR